jgi:hypothetical protein
MQMFDIVKFCQDKKCQQNIKYKQLKTSGNDPTLPAALRYSQIVRTVKPKTSQDTSS